MNTVPYSIIAFMTAGVMILTLSFPVTFANGVSAMGGPPMGPQFLLTQVIASGDDVYLLWQHGGTLFFQRSIDGGTTFEKPIGVLGDKGSISVEPQMSVSGNNVYLTANYVDNETSYLVFKRSIDNGASFGNVTTLDIRQHSLGFLTLNLVSSDDNVYLAWDENGGDIFLKKSNDDGVTFGDAINISNGTKSFGDPKIAVSNKHVYIVMESGCKINTVNEQICYPAPFVTTSNDYGKTFGKIIPIVNGTESAFSTDAKISTKGDHVYVVWQYNGYNVGKILFAKSDDAGATFGKTVYFENTGQEGHPTVVSSGSNVYLIWQTHSNETKDLIFTHSKDDGNTFASPVNLSNNKFYGDNYYLSRQIEVSGSNIYVVWSARDYENQEIFFKKSSDGGVNFGNVVNLSGNLDAIVQNETNQTRIYFDMPQIATSGNDIYVGWMNYYTEGDNDLFMKTSVDSGETFGNAITLNSDETIPEFPFAIPILLISITSLVIFYRIRFRK
jgi:hypothetical protein